MGEKKNWQVKVFIDSHTCIPNGECEMLKVPAIARLFMDKLRYEDLMSMKIEEIIKERWKIRASRNQCQAARLKALKSIGKEYDEQFKKIRNYAKEIIDANPGSSVEVDTVLNDEDKEVFSRFYVCFGILRRTWKDTCRRLIGVDGSFLKTRMKGQLLSVIGCDASNKMYPIAWTVVQVENRDNWVWFVKKIKSDLALGDGDGLIKAVSQELPSIEHRKCVRHIYGNLKAKHGKKTDMKLLIWNLAWNYSTKEYEENMERLKEYDMNIFEDVVKSNPKSWCRAFYKLGNYCEDVENNSKESFNSTIVKAREKAFVPMLETIRRLAIVHISTRYNKANNHTEKCTPYVAEFLQLEHDKASLCKVYRDTHGVYEVVLYGQSYRVDMQRRTCTCFKWEITGILCEHAYGVILDKKFEAEDYVSDWFYTSRWRYI